MQGLPATSVPRERSRRIGATAIILGYIVAVVGIPAAASAIISGWDALAIEPGDGPVADTFLPRLILALLFSPILSWIGVILSLPVVIVCRRTGWTGWGPALATGLATATVALAVWVGTGGVSDADTPPTPWRDDALPIVAGGAILALGFWGTVRLLVPAAFRADLV